MWKEKSAENKQESQDGSMISFLNRIWLTHSIGKIEPIQIQNHLSLLPCGIMGIGIGFRIFVMYAMVSGPM